MYIVLSPLGRKGKEIVELRRLLYEGTNKNRAVKAFLNKIEEGKDARREFTMSVGLGSGR